MTTLSSSCWPRRSDASVHDRRGRSDGFERRLPLWLLVACAIGAALLGAVESADGACDGCGSVRGSVAVEQAAVRTDGPKHDLDVVAFLTPADGKLPPPAAGARAEMDQRGLVFVPHVLAVQRGTTVTFLNNDNDEHNVYFLDDRTGDTLDIGTWGRGVSVDHTFDEAGTIITLCKLHLEMAAYIVVVPTPWFAAIELDGAGQRGEFAIPDVPPGNYELTIWHKKLKQKGGAATVTVAPGAAVGVETVITKAKYAKEAG